MYSFSQKMFKTKYVSTFFLNILKLYKPEISPSLELLSNAAGLAHDGFPTVNRQHGTEHNLIQSTIVNSIKS